MLTDNIISEIEDAIERELRNARMAHRHEEKMKCYERVAILKETLDPKPKITKEAILEALSDAVNETTEPTPTHSHTEIIVDLANLFRRRR